MESMPNDLLANPAQLYAPYVGCLRLVAPPTRKQHSQSSLANVMLRSPGQAQGGQQQGGSPRMESLWHGWRKRCPLLVGVNGRLFP
eukprot:1153812-Pelagomonas_calceolata.AAC.1